MKTPQPKMPSAEPRLACSVEPKRTNKTEDRTSMKTSDELLKEVINEAKIFGRRVPLKSASKKTETLGIVNK